jgi:hypothetical protein
MGSVAGGLLFSVTALPGGFLRSDRRIGRTGLSAKPWAAAFAPAFPYQAMIGA